MIKSINVSIKANSERQNIPAEVIADASIRIKCGTPIWLNISI